MPRVPYKTHVVEWQWLIAIFDSWETEPPPGEGGEGPRGDYQGK